MVRTVLITGPKNVRMANWEESICVINNDSGRPVTATNEFHKKKVDELIR
jgi:hypothetical protein